MSKKTSSGELSPTGTGIEKRIVPSEPSAITAIGTTVEPAEVEPLADVPGEPVVAPREVELPELALPVLETPVELELEVAPLALEPFVESGIGTALPHATTRIGNPAQSQPLVRASDTCADSFRSAPPREPLCRARYHG